MKLIGTNKVVDETECNKSLESSKELLAENEIFKYATNKIYLKLIM